MLGSLLVLATLARCYGLTDSTERLFKKLGFDPIKSSNSTPTEIPNESDDRITFDQEDDTDEGEYGRPIRSCVSTLSKGTSDNMNSPVYWPFYWYLQMKIIIDDYNWLGWDVDIRHDGRQETRDLLDVPTYPSHPVVEMVQLARRGIDPCQSDPTLFANRCAERAAECASHCIQWQEYIYGQRRDENLGEMSDQTLQQSLIRLMGRDPFDPAEYDIFEETSIARSTPQWCTYNPVMDTCHYSQHSSSDVCRREDVPFYLSYTAWRDRYIRAIYAMAYWFATDAECGIGPTPTEVTIPATSMCTDFWDGSDRHCIDAVPQRCYGYWENVVDKFEFVGFKSWWSNWTGLNVLMIEENQLLVRWTVSCGSHQGEEIYQNTEIVSETSPSKDMHR